MTTTTTRKDVHQVIAAYTPKVVEPHEWDVVAPFVREHVAAVASADWPADQCRNALRLVTRLAVHVFNAGRDVSVAAVFSEGAINAFCHQELDTAATHVRGTSRATLRRIAKQVNPNFDGPRQRPEYGNESKAAPYTEAEVLGVKTWANAEHTESRRQQANLLLALALGAGLRSGEVANLTAGDVETDAEGTVVYPWGYRGADKRFVPIEREWAGVVAQAVENAASTTEWLFRPLRTTADSGTVATFTKRSPHKGTVLDMGRARTTWLVNQVKKGVPETAVIEAAGLTDLQHYRQFLVEPTHVSAREARGLLSGTLHETETRSGLTLIHGVS